jgi:hypothetical protein
MRLGLIGFSILLILLLGGGIALAQGSFQIGAFTANAGGTSTGGEYTLSGVAGEAQGSALTGGGYMLDGGFAVSSPSSPPKVYIPLAPSQ